MKSRGFILAIAGFSVSLIVGFLLVLLSKIGFIKYDIFKFGFLLCILIVIFFFFVLKKLKISPKGKKFVIFPISKNYIRPHLEINFRKLRIPENEQSKYVLLQVIYLLEFISEDESVIPDALVVINSTLASPSKMKRYNFTQRKAPCLRVLYSRFCYWILRRTHALGRDTAENWKYEWVMRVRDIRDQTHLSKLVQLRQSLSKKLEGSEAKLNEQKLKRDELR